MKRISSTSAQGVLSLSPERQQWLSRKSGKKAPSPSNALTASILNYIQDAGGYAVRINVFGGLKAGKRTKSTTRRGTADIHACFRGRHLSIEVKVGRDVMSDEQRQTEADVRKAGGLYVLAIDLQTFKVWFDSLQIMEGPDA